MLVVVWDWSMGAYVVAVVVIAVVGSLLHWLVVAWGGLLLVAIDLVVLKMVPLFQGLMAVVIAMVGATLQWWVVV